ncbi:MAG: hypothetical protein AAGE13_10310 [Pseudomonadota bacterium]
MKEAIDREEAHRRAIGEIVRFHRALEDWFRGTLPEDQLNPQLLDMLHSEFHIVFPSGVLVSCSDLCRSLRAGRGQSPELRITIAEPQVLCVFPGLILANYIEHQTGARNSLAENRRRATVLFQIEERLLWRHLHDTGLSIA